MRRIDVLAYDRRQYIADAFITLLHRNKDTAKLEKFLTEEIPKEKEATFKLFAEKDPSLPLRDYFRLVCPEEVKDWERLDAEREKRHYYIQNKIPFDVLEDGTVVKAHGKEAR